MIIRDFNQTIRWYKCDKIISGITFSIEFKEFSNVKLILLNLHWYAISEIHMLSRLTAYFQYQIFNKDYEYTISSETIANYELTNDSNMCWLVVVINIFTAMI